MSESARLVRWATEEEIRDSGRGPTEPGHRFGWYTPPSLDDWRLANESERTTLVCRHSNYQRCPNPVASVLSRSVHQRSRTGGAGTFSAKRWGYCEAHMFGRIIEDGHILEMKLAATEDDLSRNITGGDQP